MDKQEMEILIMNLIVDAGSARSFAMEAIHRAKEGDFDAAREALESANAELSKAHGVQTGLIQAEAKGEHTEINLFMVHAQDHIMTSMLARDMAKELVDVYEKIK